MSRDGLRPLSADIIAPLLRALAHVRHTPEARLTLVHLIDGRAPGWDRLLDYNVMYRGRRVGRIWRHTYARERHEGLPWHWSLDCEHRQHDWATPTREKKPWNSSAERGSARHRIGNLHELSWKVSHSLGSESD